MLAGALGSLAIALRAARSGSDNIVSASNSSLTAAAFAFDADGVTTNAITLNTENAAGNPLAGKIATVALAAKLVDAAASTVTVIPAEIPDDDTTTASIVITVTNEDGNPVIGVPVANISVTSTGTGNTIAAVSTVTSDTGQAVYTIRSSVAEVKTITVEVLGLALDDEPTVTVSGDAPATWSIEPSGYAMVAEWDNAATITPTGFALDGSPNGTNHGTTTRVTSLPWTPTHGGPNVGIRKHIDAGEPGGAGTGRLQVTSVLTDGDNVFVGLETFFPAGTAVSDQSNKIWFADVHGDGTQIVLGFQTATDPSTGRPYDNKWRITLEDGFGADAGQYTGAVSVAYGSAQVHQILLNRSDTVGRVLHVVDEVVSNDLTNVTYPAGGSISRVYYEGTNNGNHSPGPSDPRLIALPDGTEADADIYASIFYVSEPA